MDQLEIPHFHWKLKELLIEKFKLNHIQTQARN